MEEGNLDLWVVQGVSLFPLCAATHAYVPKVRKKKFERGDQGKDKENDH